MFFSTCRPSGLSRWLSRRQPIDVLGHLEPGLSLGSPSWRSSSAALTFCMAGQKPLRSRCARSALQACTRCLSSTHRAENSRTYTRASRLLARRQRSRAAASCRTVSRREWLRGPSSVISKSTRQRRAHTAYWPDRLSLRAVSKREKKLV